MAFTFKQRPSTITRELFPEWGWLSAWDWYALDVAAALTYHNMERAANEARADDEPQRRRTPGGRASNEHIGKLLRERGEDLFIRGTEIPPWERE